MGYYYHYEDCKLTIPARNIPDAANTLRQMLQNGTNYYSKDIDINERDVDLITAVALDDGWYGSVNADGDIVNPYMHNGQRKGNDGTDWLQILAPYINDGGYVQIQDDDGRTYRICFYDGKHYVASPTWPAKDDVLTKAAQEA